MKKTYKAGETIFKIGDPANSFYVVVSGSVECRHQGTADDANVAVPVFGAIAPTLGRDRDHTAVASTETTLLEIEFECANLLRVAAQHPRLSNSIFQRFGHYLDAEIGTIRERYCSEKQLWEILVSTLEIVSREQDVAGLAELVAELTAEVAELFPPLSTITAMPAANADGAIDLFPGSSYTVLPEIYQVQIGTMDVLLEGKKVFSVAAPGVCFATMDSPITDDLVPNDAFALRPVVPAKLQSFSGLTPAGMAKNYPELLGRTVEYGCVLVRELQTFFTAFTEGGRELRRRLFDRIATMPELLQNPTAAECLEVMGYTGPAAGPDEEDDISLTGGAALNFCQENLFAELGLTDERRDELIALLEQVRSSDGGAETASARAKLINRYWQMAATAAEKMIADQLPPATRDFLRFGMVNDEYLGEEQLGRLARLPVIPAEDIYFVDEWLEKIAAGEISPSEGDERLIRKVSARDLFAKAKAKVENEQGLLKARIRDWKRASADISPALEKMVKGQTALQQLMDIFDQQKDKLATIDPVLAKFTETVEMISKANRTIREKGGKMRINEGRIADGMKNYFSSLEEMRKTQAAAKGEKTELTQEKTLSSEVTSFIRQLAKMCVGPRGNHLPILMGELLSSNGRELISRSEVKKIINEAASLDPGLFQRKFKGIERVIQPYVIIIPCIAENGRCWEPFERSNRATGKGRLAIPLISRKPLAEVMYSVLGDFRWQMAREVAAHYWMEEGITGRYYQWFTETKQKGDIRESFINNYILWLAYEAKGVQKMDKDIRAFFWIHLPFPKELKENLKNRGYHYQQLCQQDENRERSSYV